MREILFRGKTWRGEWIEGYLVSGNHYSTDEKMTVLFSQNTTFFPRSEVVSYEEVLSETVGQYTGLNDKNGKKIFEGDIVRVHVETYTSIHDTIGVIGYWSGAFGVSYGNGKHFLAFNEMSMYCRWVEIIGNVHDNPELIGE